MELARFFAATLPLANIVAAIVPDNSHTHIGHPPSPSLTITVKPKLSRWDSSLSVQESSIPFIHTPKRTSEEDTAPSSWKSSSLVFDFEEEEEDRLHQQGDDSTVDTADTTIDGNQGDGDLVAASSVLASASLCEAGHSAVAKSSCQFDMTWATQSFPPSHRETAASEPPRMPHRNTEYFPEADDRDQ